MVKSDYLCRAVKFIEQHIELIDNSDYTQLYKSLSSPFDHSIIPFVTMILYQIGVDPLQHLVTVPSFYLTKVQNVSCVTIPENIKVIEDHACTHAGIQTLNLTHATNLDTIGCNAFTHCYQLTSVMIPDNVRYLNAECFLNCTNLTTVKLPADIRQIGTRAFFGCKNLRTIIYPKNKKDWNHLYKGLQAFGECDQITVKCADGEILLPCDFAVMQHARKVDANWIVSRTYELNELSLPKA